MDSELKYFWLVLIAVNCLSTLIFSFIARSPLRERPELYDGYWRLIRGMLLFFNLPFLVMGIGIVSDYVPTMNGYLSWRVSNPFVLAFYTSIFFELLLGFYWIFFAQGAEFIVKHRDLWGSYKFRIPSSSFGVKLFYLFCLICGCLVLLIGS
jgi:hypothetical protein